MCEGGARRLLCDLCVVALRLGLNWGKIAALALHSASKALVVMRQPSKLDNRVQVSILA